MPYYLSAGNRAPAMGAGFSGGVHYAFSKLSLGASYRSPVWFREFNWNRKDLTGASHAMSFQMNLPQVVSIGTGASPAKNTHIGVDARWFNYENTAGFAKSGYNADGSVAGFGWKNIWAIPATSNSRCSAMATAMRSTWASVIARSSGVIHVSPAGADPR